MVKAQTEEVDINQLKPHPKNYRNHPDDQVDHIVKSIQDNGIYRNIVIANDNTILAGHGVVLASKKMGMETIPVIRLDIGPNEPKAMKVLAGDNEISHLGEVNDRQLSEILKEIKNKSELLGTGYDERMLANLVFITRQSSEIADINEAAEWAGMPDFSMEGKLKMIITFENEDDRQSFANHLGVKITPKTKAMWWPPKEREDISSVKFEHKT